MQFTTEEIVRIVQRLEQLPPTQWEYEVRKEDSHFQELVFHTTLSGHEIGFEHVHSYFSDDGAWTYGITRTLFIDGWNKHSERQEVDGCIKKADHPPLVLSRLWINLKSHFRIRDLPLVASLGSSEARRNREPENCSLSPRRMGQAG